MKIELNTHSFEKKLFAAIHTPLITKSSRAEKVSCRRLRTETPPAPALLPNMSERYLKQFPLDLLLSGFSDAERMQVYEHLPFFEKIAANETPQVFGYHGASQEVRLFQDALKVIFEEKLGIEVPENFYFLRIPGEDYIFHTENTKKEFLDLHHKLGKELYPYAMEFFVLNPLNEEFGLQLTADQFLEEELAEIESILIDMIKLEKLGRENPFDLSASVLGDHSRLCQKISTLSGLSLYEVNQKLDELIQKGTSLGFLEDYLEEQFGVKEFPKNPDQWDDFFARYQECMNLVDPWHNFYCHFYDANPSGSSRVISMVGPLYYNVGGESCIELFLHDGSYEGHDGKLEWILDRFCVSLGMPEGTGKSLMENGRKHLPKEDPTGVIFQFFAPKEEYNKVTYLCRNCGFPIHRAHRFNTSSFIQGDCWYNLDGDTGEIEIRLIMDNATCLNPNGPIRMIRYDNLPQETGEQILSSMRETIRNAETDPEKVKVYQEKLAEYWPTY